MIGNLKEFEKFLKICHKNGLTEATLSGVSVKIGKKPVKQKSGKKAADTDDDIIETDELSPEEMMFYHLREAGANQ